MTKARLEAFSDGVLAIIITIMVLELKVPHSAGLEDIKPLFPVFMSYVLSFVFIGIYWGNHHHLLHTLHHVNSKIIWANLHLLFWLSLIPFATAWMGENHFDKLPVAVYSFLMLLCSVAYYILFLTIMSHHTYSSTLIDALLKQKKKGLLSSAMYIVATLVAFIYPVISALLIVSVAVLWIVPDRNIERALKE